ncbi:hypothetical protein LSTR_LSTR006763 [Laodelphax striatellus]|uniref:Peptidase S1 domain-containing protein n=1 Tax=Laodelphax striatellus TaxID=195883 RepID=A0A482XD88_LAOST|nr:hypothetical protein LSTR_LSTR006763 [Laodelphax striatellus]
MTDLVLNSTGRWLQLLGDLQLQSLKTRLQAPPLSPDWSAIHNAAGSESCHHVTGEIFPGFICGGSIISKKYVLSAAHCFADAKHSHFNIRIRVGEYDLSQDPDCDSEGFCAPSAKEYLASEVTIHPDYHLVGEEGAGDYSALADIAVVRIDGEFIFSDFVLPICLEYGDLLEQDYAGEIAQTIGWGGRGLDGDETQFPDKLQKVSLAILDVNICSQIQTQIPESHIICAGTHTKFSYAGDSGSPMFIAESVDGDIPRQYQIGVFVAYFGLNDTSWNGGKPPSGYTRVSYFLEWILDQMQD